MAKSQAELTLQLAAQATKVEKIGGETRTLVTLVQALQDQINNLPPASVTPELQAAADRVDEQLNVVDELVPDAPPVAEPPPVEPPPVEVPVEPAPETP